MSVLIFIKIRTHEVTFEVNLQISCLRDIRSVAQRVQPSLKSEQLCPLCHASHMIKALLKHVSDVFKHYLVTELYRDVASH